MKKIITIEDSAEESYHINPKNVVYVKHKKSTGFWKISLVNGENIMTKNQEGVIALINSFKKGVVNEK